MLPGRLPTKRVVPGGFWSIEKERDVGLDSSVGDLGDVEAVELELGFAAGVAASALAELSSRKLPKREAKAVEAGAGGEMLVEMLEAEGVVGSAFAELLLVVASAAFGFAPLLLFSPSPAGLKGAAVEANAGAGAGAGAGACADACEAAADAAAVAPEATKGFAVAKRPGGEPMALQSGPRGICPADPPEPSRV